MHANVAAMETWILRAKAANPEVELVVFPEGANGWFPNPRVDGNRSAASAFSDQIPEVMNGVPAINPCIDGGGDLLRTLSCLARTHAYARVCTRA